MAPPLLSAPGTKLVSTATTPGTSPSVHVRHTACGRAASVQADVVERARAVTDQNAAADTAALLIGSERTGRGGGSPDACRGREPFCDGTGWAAGSWSPGGLVGRVTRLGRRRRTRPLSGTRRPG